MNFSPKLAIASDMRVQDFRRELLDGYAALLLEGYPEFLERFAPLPAQPTDIPPVQLQPNQEDSTQEELGSSVGICRLCRSDALRCHFPGISPTTRQNDVTLC